MIKIRRLQGFRAKLILTFIPITIISMLCFSTIVYFLEKKNVETSNKVYINEISEARASEVGNWVQDLINDIKIMAVSDEVRSMQEDRFLPYIKNIQKMQANRITLLYVAKPDGSFTNSMGLKSNISDRDYFKNIVFHNSKLEISDPVIAKTIGKPVFVIAAPIVNDDGKIIGVIGESVLLDTISKIVSNIRIGNHGYAWIVNGLGETIAHPDKEFSVDVIQGNSSFSYYKGLKENANLILSGKAGQLSFLNNTKQAQYITYCPIPHTPQWVLAIVTLKKNVFKSTSELSNYLIIMTLVMILLVLSASYYVSGYITKPIKSLVNAIKSFEKNKKEISLVIEKKNEIGELANAFNAMNKTIMKYTNNLEEMVEEKTRELSNANSKLIIVNNRLDYINSDLREKNDNLYELATKDSLTGIMNRYELERRLDNCIIKARRFSGYVFTILFIDLDNFKYYNDTFGHDIGDEMLREISEIIKQTIRNVDIISRYGGDEFVVIIEENRENSGIIGERIISNIKEMNGFVDRISMLKGSRVTIDEMNQMSCSIGMIEFTSKHISLDYNELLKLADQALYGAKKNGKGCLYSINLDEYKS